MSVLHVAHNQIAFSMLVRSHSVCSGEYLGPPGAAARM
jgi:hypothetical protein